MALGSSPPHEVERTFLDALRTDPADDDTRRVYADWLEEQGRADRADYIRLELRVRALEPSDPMVGELQRRVDRLRRVLPRAWVTDVAPPPPAPPPVEPKIRIAVERPRNLPLPPRPPPEEPSVPSPEVAEEAPRSIKVPTRSVASQLLGLEDFWFSASPRRCRSCESTIGFWTAKCPHCGTWQLRILRGVVVLVLLVLGAVALLDDLRWQMQDDNFISGRRRGCSR